MNLKGWGIVFLSLAVTSCGSDDGTRVSVPEGEPFFSDGFESGNLNHSENGFEWTRMVWGGVTGENPKDGEKSLLFRYKAESDPSNNESPDAWSEIWFDLGQVYPEIFMEYDLYIPANYTQRPSNPNNNKWLVIWGSGDYTGSHWAGGPLLVSDNSYRYTSGDAINVLETVWNDNDQVEREPVAVPFIERSDLGRWIHLRWHLRVSETSTSTDAVIRMWKDDTLMMSLTGANIWTPQSNGFQNGYLMGWHASGYDEEVRFYLDNFKIYASNPGW